MSRASHRRKDHEPPEIAGHSATVSNAADDIRSALQNLTIELTHEEIARRAYQLYEDRGGEHGRDWQDWFQAEHELRQLFREAAGKVLAAEGLHAAV